MNINHLRYFQEVCKYNNITKASEAVHVSQPSITAAIKELENELGYQLFNRVNNRISLTDDGSSFLSKAKDFINSYDNFHRESLDIGNKTHVVLKVGIPPVLGTFMFKKFFPAFEQLHPNIRLQMFEIGTISGLKRLNEGGLDFLLGAMDDTVYPQCDSRLIFRTQFGLAVGEGSTLAKEPFASKEMIYHQPFIIFPNGSYHYTAITEHFKEHPLNIIMEASQISTIRYIVENNFAVTITYQESFDASSKIVHIPLEDPINANVSVLWRKNAYVSNAMKAFITYTSSLEDHQQSKVESFWD
ncbi:LysR family transcriptional regulator [Aminipila butyrica]|uniref:LysR family transcriptional regulator n=1 Tax=Aminipila butyrica TaxID=433296 RepID=A0A858BR86_9FIRM|nr:LysR family transcriptional regulator [Aminipila butyrica]QIB67842.1 LysR family transcriptional regulator [Aminipila butyrica]